MKKLFIILIVLASCTKTNTVVKDSTIIKTDTVTLTRPYAIIVNIDYGAQTFIDSLKIGDSLIFGRITTLDVTRQANLIAGEVDVYVRGGGDGDYINMMECESEGNTYVNYIPPSPDDQKFSMMASGTADVLVLIRN